MNDPIADLLTRIKNGYLARQETVTAPYSKFKEALCRLLQKCGYIGEISQEKDKLDLIISLIYQSGVPALTDVKRLSKPGLRRYVKAKDLNRLKPGLGYLILSTPDGLKTHFEAKKAGVGGELVCAIW